MYKLGIYLFFCGALSACTGNFTEPKHTSSPTSKATTSLTFEVIKQEILQKNCIECHENRHSAYQNYNVVKNSARAMLARMKTNVLNKRMPKGKPRLSQELIDQFEEWVNAGAPREGNSLDLGEPIGFAEVKAKVLKAYNCTECHSQYEDYQTVRTQISSIVSLIEANKMPFPQQVGGKIIPVTEVDKELLNRWIAQGLPLEAGKEAPAQGKVQLEPTWVSMRNNVIGPKCILCHNNFGSGRAPTGMSTLKELKDWYLNSAVEEGGELKLFNFKDVDKSHFIAAILGGTDESNDEFFFDPMPWNNDEDDLETDIAPVTEEELKVIREWISTNLEQEFKELDKIEIESMIQEMKNLGKNLSIN